MGRGDDPVRTKGRIVINVGRLASIHTELSDKSFSFDWRGDDLPVEWFVPHFTRDHGQWRVLRRGKDTRARAALTR